MTLGKWLADKIIDSKGINTMIEDFCSKEDIASFITENTNAVGGYQGDDDGPRYYWGNQASYKKATKKQAERLGMKVLDYISGNEEIFNLDKDTKFKTDMTGGPTGAVSYFPVGLPGVRSGTNLLQDKKGRVAYKRWASWSKYIATHIGWKLVSYMGADISAPQSKKEPMKKLAPGDLFTEVLLNEGINDKHIFKAIFLAGGPGSGKSSVVDAIFNVPDLA